MTEKHDQLRQEAMAAVDTLFADNSVPIDVTRESLEEIRDDIAVKIEALGE